MDETDLLIIKKLIENSRLPYRDLAGILNMSVSAVHKRINKLVENGNIEAFVARPSMIALKYIWVMIFGTSKTKSILLLSKELGQHENIDFIGNSGGNYIYVAGYLRDISELQDLSAYVSKTAQMSEPTIGIISVPYITMPEPLTTIDYKIIKTLNRDARKPIIDIADDVGLTAKTVRTRLNRMIENNLISLTIQVTTKGENNFDTAFHIYLKEGTDIGSTIQHLNEKYYAHCFSFSNMPNFITMHTWTKTAQASQEIQVELQTEGFKDVIPHIFLSVTYYDCWIDKLLRSK